MNLRRLRRPGRPGRSSLRPHGRRRRAFEALEDRRVMALDLASSTFSPALMRDHVAALSAGNAVGFGVAINYQGTVNAATGSGGQARLGLDLPHQNFTSLTELEVSSVSKTITATAILHLLQSRPEGLDAALRTRLNDYLPSDWSPGANTQHITLRHLLTHASGFSETNNAIDVNFENYQNNTFANLQELVEAGLPMPNVAADATYGTPRWNLGDNYNNANFTLLARVVLPKLVSPALNLSAALFPGLRDSLSGSLYRNYVQDEIFEPLGVLGADLAGNDAFPAKGYSLGADAFATGASMSDLTSLGGGFGWKLSARELATFLNGIQRNNALLAPATRQMRDAQQLGWFRSSDDFGNSYGHNGATSTGGGHFRSLAVAMPGGVEVAYLMNSQSDNLPGGSINALLKTAYVNAWTDLTVTGTDGSDVFTLDIVPDGGKSAVQIALNGEVQLTRWVESLDSITLNGGLGNDVFQVSDWTSAVELILNGGNGNDAANLLPSLRNIELVSGMTFNGGGGVDTLVADDRNNPYSMPDLSAQYAVGGSSIARHRGITLPPFNVKIALPVAVNYSGVENLDLRTGQQADVVTLSGKTSGDTTIRTGQGDDRIAMAAAAANLELVDGVFIDGQEGSDGLELLDHGKTLSSLFDFSAQYDVYGDRVSRYVAGGILLPGSGPTVYEAQFAGIENLELTTTHGKDVIRVHAAAIGTTTVHGGDGDDLLIASPADKNMELVDGLTFNGNNGRDEIVIRDENNPYSDATKSRQYEVGSSQTKRSKRFLLFTLPVEVAYAGVEDVTVATGGQDDLVNVLAASTGAMRVQTGGGDDVVVASATAQNLETVNDLHVDGGAGVDQLSLRDANNPYALGAAGGVYTIGSDFVRRFDAHPLIPGASVPVELTFAGVEQVELDGGAQGDAFEVAGDGGVGTLTLDGNNGGDRFEIDGPAFAAFVVRGEAPLVAPGDVLSVNPSAQYPVGNLPGLYPPGSGGVTIGAAEVLYSGIESVATKPQIYGGPGDFDKNGKVEGGDLAHATLGWNKRYGGALSGLDLLVWQRHFGANRLPRGAVEPASEPIRATSGGSVQFAVAAEEDEASRGFAAAGPSGEDLAWLAQAVSAPATDPSSSALAPWTTRGASEAGAEGGFVPAAIEEPALFAAVGSAPAVGSGAGTAWRAAAADAAATGVEDESLGAVDAAFATWVGATALVV